MRSCFLTILAGFLAVAAARAENVVLVAGGGIGDENIPATQAKLGMPFGVEFDSAGDLFFVEIDGHRACRIDKSGLLTRIAGTREKGLSDGGGKPLAAQFNALHNLAIAPNDDIYLADTLNHRVCKIDKKTGVFSTVVGTGEKGFSGDGGPAVKAQFSGIYCASLNPTGEQLYLADLDNRRIRRVDLKSGIVTTIAGNGEKGVPADGADAAKSPLVDPRAVTVDRAGNVYVLERGGHALRVVDAGGKIRTVVGTGQKGNSGDDGPAIQATMNGPKHLCIDRDGGVLIADTENHVIRKYWPQDGRISRIAGSGKRGAAGVPGPTLEVELNQPHGVYLRNNGEIYISDATNHRILKVIKGN